jgi:hypothetical protein
MGGIDPKLPEVLDRRRAEQIVAHPCDHKNIGPAKPGRDRLICSLAPKAKIELLAKNCFSDFRKTIRKGS